MQEISAIWVLSFSSEIKEELSLLAGYMTEGKDIRSSETIAKHADWVEEFLPKYKTVTEENVMDILKTEVGRVFAEVLEDAGGYKRTGEGRAAFLRFTDSVNGWFLSKSLTFP